MGFFSSIKKSLLTKKSAIPTQRFCPQIEGLESRVVPYTTSGNMWPSPQLVTISFMPDGTSLGSTTSNLFSTFNAKFGSAATWQNVILKAAQTWAQQTNLNFAVVSDSGVQQGTGNYQQGDPTMGDIRIGGYNMGTSGPLAEAFMPPSVNNYSIAGDMEFNTGQTFNINGQNYDLFTVAMHEFGHALGLLHSTQLGAVMYGSYGSPESHLTSDDVNGIRNIYSNNNPRSPDQFGSLNNSFAAAANLNGFVNTGNDTALVTALDITNAGEKDYYTLTAPTGTGSTVTISAQSQGLSLLAPTLTVYAADQVTVLGSASGYGHYGYTLTLNLTNKIAAGQQFYVKVGGADTTAFGTGAYGLTMSFAGNSLPTVPLPNTQLANGSPLSGGGGIANAQSNEFTVGSVLSGISNTGAVESVATSPNGNFVTTWTGTSLLGGSEVYAQMYDSNGSPAGLAFQVNTTTTGQQVKPAVAVSANGNFVITWSSYGQDGSGWGVYAQLFDPNGNPIGSEFQVNTTTAGDQTGSVAAMDANGNFAITWQGQDPTSGVWNVYVQRYNASATPVGGETQVNPYTSSDNTSARVAMDAAGDTVVVWSSNGQDGSGWGIYGQRYDPNGNVVGGEFLINTTTAGDQMYPSVAMNQYGQSVVTWSSNGQDGSGWGVYLQQYDATGAPIGGETQANTTTAGDQMNSSVSMDPEGNFMVTWQSNAGGQTGSKAPIQLGAGDLSLGTSGANLTGKSQVVTGKDGATGWNIYAQQFDNNRNPMGDEFRVNTTVLGDQTIPSITMDGLGTIVVLWTNTTVGIGAVMGQRYAVGADNLDPSSPSGTNDASHQSSAVRLEDLANRTDRVDQETGATPGQLDQDHAVIDQLLEALADATGKGPATDTFFAQEAALLAPGLAQADAGLATALDSTDLGDDSGDASI